MTAELLTACDVEFEIILHAEDESPDGYFDSDDDDMDRADVEHILGQLASGNEWAWCTVEVKATSGDFEGSAFLGCCSYASEEDFKAEGGYFADMKDEALDALNASIAESLAKLPTSALEAELSRRNAS